MEWKSGYKVLICSIILGIILTVCMISVGLIERILIIVSSLMMFFFIFNYKRHSVKSICVLLIGVIIGFQLVSIALFLFDFKNIEDFEEYMDDNGSAEIAVLLILPGEPERYSVSSLLGYIKENISISEAYEIPIKLYKYKRAYEWAGLSRYKEYSRDIKDKLSQHLGQDYDVYLAYSQSQPDFIQVFNNSILNKKYAKLITVPVYLSENNDYTSIINEIDLLNLYHRNIKVKYMNTLFESEKIIKGIIQEINKENGESNKSDFGFIITDFWLNNNADIFNAKSKNQEKHFMEKIKSMLIENGFDERKIKYADFNSDRKGIEGSLVELQQYGVSDIFIIGINSIWNFVDEAYKMERIINKMEGREKKNLIYIEGWGLNNWLIDELEYRIRILNTQEWNL